MREKGGARRSSGRTRKTIGPTHTPTSFVAEAMTEVINQEVAASVRLPKTLFKWALKMKMSVLKKGATVLYDIEHSCSFSLQSLRWLERHLLWRATH